MKTSSTKPNTTPGDLPIRFMPKRVRVVYLLRRGNGETLPLSRAKLTIGRPNDPYEQEADRVADQVVQRLEQPVRSCRFNENVRIVSRKRKGYNKNHWPA
ncbi:MAG: hypothetical protein IPJ40_18280 [Saprospirales bacterium]|nr:hypothetical protein [Saprospirales bacterium]